MTPPQSNTDIIQDGSSPSTSTQESNPTATMPMEAIQFLKQMQTVFDWAKNQHPTNVEATDAHLPSQESFPNPYPSFSDDPQMRVKPQEVEYFPSEDERKLFPAVQQNNSADWFKATTAEEERMDKYRLYPRNNSQKYVPPSLTSSLNCSKQCRETDAILVKHQQRLAHLTRPIDSLVHHGLQIRDPDDELMEAVLAFAQFMREELSYFAGAIHKTRLELVKKDHQIPTMDTGDMLVDPQTLVEQKRAANALAKGLAKDTPTKGKGKPRSQQQQHARSQYRTAQQQQQRPNQRRQQDNDRYSDNDDDRTSYSNKSERDQGKGQSRGQNRGRSKSRHYQTDRK
ncbi:hypothetical protein BGX27_003889 [Mortierella sp. AM989]|nr:hypothetical protein BGX27_003889 [Mortierella sp. AM989]